mmetsp:Transcript_153591/g.492283  ORF Transcript_153591/g.492283 Transcript_153591/m.492283 type:complete len:191 (+) Transcript_153591:72-644(+)
MFGGFLGNPPPPTALSCFPAQAPVFTGGFSGVPASSGDSVSLGGFGKQSQVQAYERPEDLVRQAIQRGVQQHLVAAPPQWHSQHAAPSPLQVLIQNTTSSSTEQQTINASPPPPPLPPAPPLHTWEGLRHFFKEFWASPFNRLFTLGALGAFIYIYQGRQQHRWRMAEMQRRIDSNPFLRFWNSLLPPSR